MKIFTDRASLDGRYRERYARLPEEKTLLPQTLKIQPISY
jgi:hypothetical protein